MQRRQRCVMGHETACSHDSPWVVGGSRPTHSLVCTPCLWRQVLSVRRVLVQANATKYVMLEVSFQVRVSSGHAASG